jgi:hypothetical protein
MIRVSSFAAAFLASGILISLASGFPLDQETAFRAHPADHAPAIATLPAGTVVAPVDAEALAEAGLIVPAGWTAIQWPAAFEAWVFNGDFAKDLTVKEGSALRQNSSKEAPILAIAGPEDQIDLISVQAEHSRVLVRKSMIGYIAAIPPTLFETVPLASASSQPAFRIAADANRGSRPETRILEGYLQATPRFAGHRGNYPIQLVDAEGRRIAFVDASMLFLTEPIERLFDQKVMVHGPVQPDVRGRDLVIRAEVLRLKP